MTAAALVGAIESLRHGFAVSFGNTRTGVPHSNCRFTVAVNQTEFNAAAFGREFHRVIDQIGDRLKEKIAVAMNDRLAFCLDLERYALVLGDRLIDVTNLAQQRRERNLAETVQPARVLDFGYAQQGGGHRQRLVKPGNRLIDDGAQLLQRPGVCASALEAHTHTRQRRTQIVGNIIADPGNFLDQAFNIRQHPTDDGRKLIEGVIASAGRQPLPKIAGYDALDPLVDLLDPALRANAQYGSTGYAQKERRKEAHCQCLLDDLRNVEHLSTDHHHIAVLEPARNSAHGLDLSRQGLLRRRTDLKIRRHDLNIAGYALALCGEQARIFDIERIVPRKTVKHLQPLIGWRRQKDLCLHGDDGVGSRQQELFSPPIHEAEQRNEEYGEHARHSNGPAKRRAANEIKRVHGG